MEQSTLLELLLISWAVITAVLVLLLIYRGTLASKEDDQIFIGEAEQHHARDNEVIIAKMTQLNRPIVALSVISGLLLLTSAGLWVYRGLMGT